jgi:drug/metabolite transporter (DMT)-like permease
VGVFCTLILSAIVPFYWADPDWLQLGLLLVLGGLGLCAHFLMAKSYRYASSSVLAPLGYLQIIFAVAYGILLFGNYPGTASMFGIGLIFLSGLMVYARRQPVAPVSQV